MRDWRKYKVWELSHEFVLEIYQVTTNFPKEEVYNLTSQLRRACL
ncbi:MAG: four helix bundle protein, partial [Bacteroidetes bacterium]|nr:four helix bundle protein [Bacteroidota bacterium]